MRPMLLLLALTLPLAACGGSSGSDSPPATSLTITNWPAGKDGPSKTHTVTCPGDGEVCELLAALPAKAFEPVPAGMICTDIFGGPDEAHVQGTLDGKPVDATYSRRNGCEIARWNAVTFLLGSAG